MTIEDSRHLVDFILLAILGGVGSLGFYMAWNIGANDVANSMATAVGARAITFKQAVIIAGVLTFLGAVLVGSHVTDTSKGNIVNPCVIGDSHTLLLGYIASLLAACCFVAFSHGANDVAFWLNRFVHLKIVREKCRGFYRIKAFLQTNFCIKIAQLHYIDYIGNDNING